MWFQPPPPPVSYHRQVAPILALHCSGCHGTAGGLSTRSHAELMRGGDMGPVVKPGDSGASLLLDFIEGRRGEAHRMPLGGRPLAPEQIAVIRRWIAAGAAEDADTGVPYAKKLRGVRFAGAPVLRVVCKVDVEAWLTLRVTDAGGRRTLFTDAVSVKSPQERGDAGSPGEPVRWEIRRGRNWPARVELELTIRYAPREPRETEFYVERPRR